MAVTMREFVKDMGIRITFDEVDENPYMSDQNWQARHYKVRLTCQGRSLTTYFSKGMGLEYGVEAAEVVNAMASDGSSAENARDWRDFAEEMGMDVGTLEEGSFRSRAKAEEYGYEKEWDKREQAKKTYKACIEAGKKLKQLVGSNAYARLTDGSVEQL